MLAHVPEPTHMYIGTRPKQTKSQQTLHFLNKRKKVIKETTKNSKFLIINKPEFEKEKPWVSLTSPANKITSLKNFLFVSGTLMGYRVELHRGISVIFI